MPPSQSELPYSLKSAYCKLFLQISLFEGSCPKSTHEIAILNNRGNELFEFACAQWRIVWDFVGDKSNDSISIVATVQSGVATNVALSLIARFSQWSPDVYVVCPGAAYNGNRFLQVDPTNSMLASSNASPCPARNARISNVPRLLLEPGESQMQFLAGDMSFGCVGLFLPHCEKGMIFTSAQQSQGRDTSFSVRENENRNGAEIIIRTPGIREKTCWKSGRYYPSPDKASVCAAGEKLQLSCKISLFDASALQTLFDQLVYLRNIIAPQKQKHEMPFSAAFNLIESKYNRDSWVAQEGYYSVGMRENQWQNWQTGWTGGMNAVYPLLTEGSDITRNRVLRTFDFLCNGGISPSGFFYDVYHDSRWRGNETDPDKNPQIGLLRRNSDALFFIIKELTYYNSWEANKPLSMHCINAVRGCADAFVTLWEKEGQFGQWINLNTGNLVGRDSASNGIAPGALALASQFFKTTKYLDVAITAAHYYYSIYVQCGIINGGPGDAFQCPDSESSFGLLESFVTLYEITGDVSWIDKACNTANQCATWVVPYDFKFPSSSTFDRMGMQTTGTVIANVQNKHSAPGICSLSGSSLFRLYRATGNEFYLSLIRDIAHAIPQFVSRDDRPIPDIREKATTKQMPSGWINERVNMSDWEEVGSVGGDISRGEIFAGSCWSEVSCLLTYAELPGVYVQTDTGFVCALDHIDVVSVSLKSDTIVLELFNPTAFDAVVKFFAEKSTQCKTPLHLLAMTRCMRVCVPAKETFIVTMSKT